MPSRLPARPRPLVDDTLLQAELELAVGVAELPLWPAAGCLPEAHRRCPRGLGLDPPKAVELLIWAICAASIGGDPTARRGFRLAAEVVPQAGMTSPCPLPGPSPRLRGRGGDTTSAGPARGGVRWASTSDDAQHVYAVSVAALFLGDNRRFATLINRATSLARARGEFGILAEALSLSAVQHLSGATLRRGSARGGRGLCSSPASSVPSTSAATPLGLLAHVAAIRGDDERRSARRRDARACRCPRLPARATSAVYTLAMLDLGRGRWTEALEHFRVSPTPARGPRHDPRPKAHSPTRSKPRCAQAAWTRLVSAIDSPRTGWPTRATSWAPSRLRAVARSWPRARGDRALRGGTPARADAGPFDLARIQLLYGEHLRRERHRTDARVQLRAALEAFERLRAEPWAERARAELRASGETARKRDPSTVDQLTPQELQIARFVAEGLSNKEVAAQLFLSPGRSSTTCATCSRSSASSPVHSLRASLWAPGSSRQSGT